jgi:hypothetical protein
MEEFWELAGYTHFKNLLRAEEAGVFIHQLLLVTRAELPPLGWGGDSLAHTACSM